MTAFAQGAYLIAFVGTTNGIVQCQSYEHMVDALKECYPNPGDPTLARLRNPANWTEAGDGMPYFVEALHDDGMEDYRVSVYRQIEIES